MPRLRVLRGEVFDREVELKNSTVRLGRGPTNDVPLEDEGKSISRNHAEIRYEGGRYVLVDLGSQNGVWVAGKKVPRVVLEPDVVASLGPYRLMFDPTDAPVDSHEMKTEISANARAQIERAVAAARAAKGDSAATARPGAVSSSGSKARSSSDNWLSKQPMWLLATAAVVLLGIVTAVIVMSVLSGPSVTVRDETAAKLDAQLTAAGGLIQAGDCAGALSQYILPALTTDPSNVRALELKTRAEACVAPPPVDPPPPPTLSPEAIRGHLQEAAKLIEAGTCPIALTEHIDLVLASEPTNAEALQLKAKAEVCQPPAAPPPVPTGGPLAVRIPPEKGGLEPLSRELQRDYDARVKAMRERYQEAVGALSSGAFQKADELFGGIIREVMTDRYLDAGAMWLQAKDGLKQMALRIYNGAIDLEKREEWDKAIAELRRAHDTDPGTFSVDNDIKRITDKKLAAGQKMCNDARANFAFPNRNAEAQKAYDEVIRLLPANHECVVEAKARLPVLRSK